MFFKNQGIKTKYLFKYLVTLSIALFWVVSPLKAEINNQTLGVLVNVNDPESIEIAKYYQRARLIPDKNIIYLSFTRNVDSLTALEFEKIDADLREKVSDDIQAYALAWRRPWRVACMSITSAFSLGFSKDYCAVGCKKTQSIDYYNSHSRQPYTDFGIRPSMMLSGNSVEVVKKLIDKGVAADYMQPKASAYLLSTSDKQRNIRAVHYSDIKNTLSQLLNIEQIKADAIKSKTDVMFYFTGLQKVKYINTNKYMPGAIADHLTSSGGQLFEDAQMSMLDWVDAGVTGTYGTVVEPCNFVQKFPNPGIVMQKYLSGNSLIEAYWKSVQMPGQGLFIGEPLASPYKGCKTLVNKMGVYQYYKNLAKNFVEKLYKNCD
jgi:uncharacterized protein (TIGR03790 family)